MDIYPLPSESPSSTPQSNPLGLWSSQSSQLSSLCDVAASHELSVLHGRVLMGNSLLDIIVFGRNAGINAAAAAKKLDKLGKPTLKHVKDFAAEQKAAGIKTDKCSPILIPNYARNAKPL